MLRLVNIVRVVSGFLAAAWIFPGGCVALVGMLADRGTASLWTHPVLLIFFGGFFSLIAISVAATFAIKKMQDGDAGL